MSRVIHRALALALGAGALVSCGHTAVPKWDPQSGRLCASHGCYRVGSLGTEWRFVRASGSEAAFFNERIGAVIAGKASCRDDAEEASLRVLTEHLLAGYTERRPLRSELAAVAGREALRTVVEAKLDGVQMMLDLYVLKKDGCIFDLAYSAPPDHYEDGSAAFARFIAGFADERRS